MADWKGRKWLHFVVLGSLLYVGVFLTRVDPPLPLLPQPTDAEIATMRANWLKRVNSFPNQIEMRELLRDWTDRELLFREALRLNLYMTDTLIWRRLIRNLKFVGKEGSESSLLREALQLGLHEIDPVIKKRLLQTMEDRARATVPMPEEKILRQAYEQRLEHEFTRARRSFSHVFYSHDKHAKEAMRRITKNFKCSLDAIESNLGEMYPAAPKKVPLSTEQQIAKNFGTGFADEIMTVSLQKCAGPINSAYGVHWVYVHEHRKERMPYSQVRPLLLEEWLRAQTAKVLATQAQNLRASYQPVAI